MPGRGQGLDLAAFVDTAVELERSKVFQGQEDGRDFTAEFKAETVALLESSGRLLSQMAGELGIEQSVLRSWWSGAASYGHRYRSRCALLHLLAMDMRP